MTEVLGRRLDRALAGDESFLPLPDIFLIDGGQGQAAVAQAQLDARGIQIPLYGMVKDSHHRTRALITPQGQELGITATPPVFALIGRVQEEVHRFAIEYNRSVRAKGMKHSSLEGVPGLGAAREKALMQRFGSIRGIRAATAEELADVLPAAVAQALFDRLHAPNQDKE